MLQPSGRFNEDQKRLGEMLVDAGLLSEDKLKQALVEQKKAGLKLGQYLTRMGNCQRTANNRPVERTVKYSEISP